MPETVTASTKELAKRLEREAMLGGPEEGDDPVVDVLWREAKRWLLGGCVGYALALAKESEGTVIALECRKAGTGDGDWTLRHAGLHRGDPQQCLAEIAAGRGDRLAVVDALGEGTFDDRMDLYWLDGHEFRVVTAEGRPWSDGKAAETTVHLLPGPCLALGLEFDVEACLAEIEARPGTRPTGMAP